MTRKNLTTKEIHDADILELIFRMNCLHAESKRRDEDAAVPITDIWEANTIIKELKHRLGRLSSIYVKEKDK